MFTQHSNLGIVPQDDYTPFSALLQERKRGFVVRRVDYIEAVLSLRCLTPLFMVPADGPGRGRGKALPRAASLKQASPAGVQIGGGTPWKLNQFIFRNPLWKG